MFLLNQANDSSLGTLYLDFWSCVVFLSLVYACNLFQSFAGGIRVNALTYAVEKAIV